MHTCFGDIIPATIVLLYLFWLFLFVLHGFYFLNYLDLRGLFYV